MGVTAVGSMRQTVLGPTESGLRRSGVASTLKDLDLSRIDDPTRQPDFLLATDDALGFLRALPPVPIFDLVVTSPPYNIGKSYEKPQELGAYLAWQESVIRQIHPRLRDTGSVCWQVGNFVENGTILPLDIELAPVFKRLGMQLRNRIVWRFGHGMHSQRRFSGRYEVILWYTKTDDYVFDLDAVRIPSKYPGKRYYRGPKKGQYSGHQLGKNPEDVWDIPNVKSNHVEKTIHPCQFPVGLVERLVLSMTQKSALVFDPFAGVASSGVAAAVHGRRFWGVEKVAEYVKVGRRRIQDALDGHPAYRPHDKPIMDPAESPLSIRTRKENDDED